jgi:hypothetical protein
MLDMKAGSTATAGVRVVRRGVARRRVARLGCAFCVNGLSVACVVETPAGVSTSSMDNSSMSGLPLTSDPAFVGM